MVRPCASVLLLIFPVSGANRRRPAQTRHGDLHLGRSPRDRSLLRRHPEQHRHGIHPWHVLRWLPSVRPGLHPAPRDDLR
ncbi:hypothetical protein L596_011430 [Steinernema carpocapsae]|uniref:Secreted protein n=1 Tax=Steinernema carpocapsae TaxID=34508 RepID=A0A4U5NTW1_STECR|nr:hypothetical protein L596_011430 [Steinernema carpocapsae]